MTVPMPSPTVPPIRPVPAPTPAMRPIGPSPVGPMPPVRPMPIVTGPVGPMPVRRNVNAPPVAADKCGLLHWTDRGSGGRQCRRRSHGHGFGAIIRRGDGEQRCGQKNGRGGFLQTESLSHFTLPVPSRSPLVRRCARRCLSIISHAALVPVHRPASDESRKSSLTQGFAVHLLFRHANRSSAVFP
jgi:hypothetical protein